MTDIADFTARTLPRPESYAGPDIAGAFARGLGIRELMDKRQEADRKHKINESLQALFQQHGGDISSPELQQQAMGLDYQSGLALKNAAQESDANKLKVDAARQKLIKDNFDQILEMGAANHERWMQLPDDQRTPESLTQGWHSMAEMVRTANPGLADTMLSGPVDPQHSEVAYGLYKQRMAAKMAGHGSGNGGMVHSSFDVVDPASGQLRRAYLDKSGGFHVTDGVVPTAYHYGMGETGAWRGPSKGPGTVEPVTMPGQGPIMPPGTGRDVARAERERANFENPTRAKDLETLKEAETNYQKLMGAADNLEGLLKRHGTEFQVGPINAETAKQLSNAYQAVLYSIRSPEMANTGVLNPGEIPMLEQSLADPTKLLNQGQADAILKQIAGLRDTANRNIGTVRRVRGGEIPSPSLPTFKTGQTATGPGGKKIRWNGQSWEPMQ